MRAEETADGQPVVKRIVDNLRREISLGRWRPSERLGIEEMRARFGVSAISMREALSVLTGEGYVTALPQRGFFVSAYSRETLRDMTRVRGEMECVGLRWSMQNSTVDWRAAVVGAHHALREVELLMARDRKRHAVEWDQRNRDYHLSLCEACGSPALLAQIASFYDLTRRYRLASLDDIAIPGDASFRQHEEILHLVLDGRAAEAEAALRAHIIDATNEL
jgi:DNA-binding GntR family transcriptional regulator